MIHQPFFFFLFLKQKWIPSFLLITDDSLFHKSSCSSSHSMDSYLQALLTVHYFLSAVQHSELLQHQLQHSSILIQSPFQRNCASLPSTYAWSGDPASLELTSSFVGKDTLLAFAWEDCSSCWHRIVSFTASPQIQIFDLGTHLFHSDCFWYVCCIL